MAYRGGHGRSQEKRIFRDDQADFGPGLGGKNFPDPIFRSRLGGVIAFAGADELGGVGRSLGRLDFQAQGLRFLVLGDFVQSDTG